MLSSTFIDDFGSHRQAPIPLKDHFYTQYTVNERSDGLVCMTMDGQIKRKTGENPIFTADLRQFGWWDAQLNVRFGWRWTTWNPAGPMTTALSTPYLYKAWNDRGIELKAGYLQYEPGILFPARERGRRGR